MTAAGSKPASKLSRALAMLRAHGAKAAVEIAVNFALPFAIYSALSGRLGAAPALMAASGPPILWSVVEFIRLRKVDAIAVLVLAGIALSLLAFAGGGGVKALQLRENLVLGLVGLVFLGSAAIGRPLIRVLARAGARRRSAEAGARVAALDSDAGFRRALTATTLVWGVGLVGVCAANCALAFAVPIRLYLLLSGPVAYGVLGLLSAWTFWYIGRAARQAKPPGPDPVRP